MLNYGKKEWFQYSEKLFCTKDYIETKSSYRFYIYWIYSVTYVMIYTESEENLTGDDEHKKGVLV